MTRKLATQIIRRGDDPAEVLPTLDGVETRRPLRAARTQRRSTSRMYRFWLRKYTQWCPGMGYQPDAASITDRRIAEFARWLTGGDDPYAPRSVLQAISALVHWAGRADADPPRTEAEASAPTGAEARAVVNTFVELLQAKGLVPGADGQSR